MYIIVGNDPGSKTPVYWQGWTGSCIKGRPKWTYKLTKKCYFEKKSTVEKIIAGEGTNYYSNKFNSSVLDDIGIVEIGTAVIPQPQDVKLGGIGKRKLALGEAK